MSVQHLRSPVLVISAVVMLLFGPGSQDGLAAGVTIITHGLNGNVDNWVIALAESMGQYYRLPGNSSTCYELYFIPTNSTYTLSTAVGDAKTSFSFKLDGLTGATPKDQILDSLKAHNEGWGSFTDWEVNQLNQAGRLPGVNFYSGGKLVPNPF
jgi:hypothetical protein